MEEVTTTKAMVASKMASEIERHEARQQLLSGAPLQKAKKAAGAVFSQLQSQADDLEEQRVRLDKAVKRLEGDFLKGHACAVAGRPLATLSRAGAKRQRAARRAASAAAAPTHPGTPSRRRSFSARPSPAASA